MRKVDCLWVQVHFATYCVTMMQNHILHVLICMFGDELVNLVCMSVCGGGGGHFF